MAKEVFYCEICHAPMELIKQFSTVKRVHTMYRRRKYKCTVCDFEEMICGDGTRDKQLRPGLMKTMDLSDMIKQEEDNIGYDTDCMGNCFSDADPGL